MVELADVKRREYAPHAPVFQHPAADAKRVHRPWFEKLVNDAASGTFVHESATGQVDGFLVVTIERAPPVYDPGGASSLVDDFAVSSPDLWHSAGSALLDTAKRWALERGAVQVAAAHP
ncbi:MAG: hypothetical protein M3130_08850 [Actinomycetota bacterium]|nr:hypothetical protein [Actinomycetota bacterium]